jgi:hypothetical protein
MIKVGKQEVSTMTTVHVAWEELSERLQALGLKLKLHFEQSRDGDVTGTVDRLRADVQGAFEAAGNAVQDEAVRADMVAAGRLLAEAVGATLEKVGGEVREAASRRPEGG